jgi:small GTP-binding protein
MTIFNSALQTFSARREDLIKSGEELRLFLDEAGMQERGREVSGHLLRLELDSVKIAVIGEFKAGKSTLINAMLGKEVLPTWTVECTAAITQVGYGEEPAMVVHKTDGSEAVHPLTDLKEMATTLNSCFEDISYIEARYPAELLKNGLVIVDTPGMNSAVKARGIITKKFMKIADAAVLVLNVEYLLKQSEIQFIRDEVSQSNYGAVFVVVNRCDLYRDQPEQLKSALDKAAVRLKELIPNLEKIYPLSALNALEAREDGDSTALVASGIEELENDLGRYVAERGALDRLARTGAAFAEILEECSNDCRLRLAGLTLDKEKVDVYARKATENLKKEGERLDTLKSHIHEGFVRLKEKMADGIRERADESRRNLTSLYGGVHSDPPEPSVIEERITNDSTAWLANAEHQWGSFYNDMLVYTSNYLSAIDRELSSGLVVDAGGGTLLELSLSPVRVEVQTNVREQTEYIDQYQAKPKQKAGGMSGLGIGLMLGGLILGGWLGAGLAIFGGASLFGNNKSWDDDEEMDKIRKPMTKQITEFTLASLEAPYNRLTTEMLTHLDKVLHNALKGLLAQVETIARGHHEKLRTQIGDIEQKRTSEESSQEIVRLQKVLEKIEKLAEGLKG